MSLSNADQCFARATIGIVSMSPGNAASVNLKITEEIINAGITLDQHHPEILVVGLPTSDISLLKSAANICKDFGADVIVVAESMPSDVMHAEFSYLDMPIFAMIDEVPDITSLAAAVTAYLCKPQFHVRPNILYGRGLTVHEDLIADRNERDARMRRRGDQGGYPILKQYKEKFVGVLGGAGPIASAAFCLKCTDFGVPFVCYSNTSAPSKNDFEVNDGPNYIEHYKNSCHFFESICPGAFVITCNTAHMRINEYLQPFQNLYSRFVDIRSGILDNNGRRIIGDKCILLGTKRTTGVGLASGEAGLYEDYRRSFYSDYEIITGSTAQQKMISSAIIDAKAGLMSVASASEKNANDNSTQNGDIMYAREKILHVVNELRMEHGRDVSVVLGCTELPLPFSVMEMSHYGFFDPAQLLVEVVRKCLIDPAPTASSTSVSSVDII